MPANILFISHEASRTGAPIVLLHLMKWIKENTDINFSILLKAGGELEEEFKSVASTVTWSELNQPVIPDKFTTDLQSTSYIKRTLKSWFREPKKAPLVAEKKDLVEAFMKESQFDLVYANSISTTDIVISLRQVVNTPVICHVHELEFAIKYTCGADGLKKANPFISRYIAVADSVKQNLVINHEIDKRKIDLVYEFVPAKKYSAFYGNEQRDAFRQALGIAADAFVVCASGTINWRKGTDLFIQLAHQVAKSTPQKVLFLWVGGNCPPFELDKIQYDIKKLRMDEQILLTGSKINVIEYLAAADVFVSMSREDPFPLVCLEAAAVGKPILCFSHSGGMPEFVGDDCGKIVPYLDIEAMRRAVIHFMNNTSEIERLGQNAKRKVLAHCDIHIPSEKIVSIINGVVSANQ